MPSATSIRSVGRVLLHVTRVLSLVLLVIGAAMVATALARGGGPLSVGVVLGTALALLGAGRLFLARQRPPRARA